MSKWVPILFTVAALFFQTTQASAVQRALIYKGPGACDDGCYQAAYLMAIRAGFDPIYVAPNALNSASTKAEVETLFRDVALWIQPGGKSRIVVNTMTPQLKQALQNFVSQGGGYVGFCAGAFASTERVGTTGYAGFNFMPGRTVLYNSKRSADIIALNWGGQTRHVYWEGGPYLTEMPAGRAEVRATYPNGQIAAARSTYGQGRVYVTGLHPEAPESWRTDYRLNDPDGLDYELVMEMVNWVTRR